MNNYISEYKHYLIGVEALSKNTYNSYIRDAEQYCNFLINYRKVNNPEDIDAEDIKGYITSIKRKNNKVSTQARKVTAIKKFHKFLFLEKYTSRNVSIKISSPKLEKKLPIILSIEEANILLDSLKIETNVEIRDTAMIHLAYASGLRVSELINLQLYNLHFKLGFIEVIGKGNKQRVIPISEEAIHYVELYLQNTRPIFSKSTNTTLFLNQRGQPLTRQSFNMILKDKVKVAGIKKHVTPHTLRHSIASHLLENGLDLRMIQELLGHEDISTTEIYTHINNKKLKEIYLNAHPRARK